MASIGIVGGGFSGAIAAYRLIGALPAGSEIVIHEPNEDLGRGVAYSDGPDHFLLNVPARQQSPCAEDPEGFLKWMLARHGDVSRFQQADGAYFVPRSWFGTYMSELLAERAAARPRVSLRHVRTPITGLRGDGTKLVGLTRNGTRTFDAIVLALGNAPPRPLPILAEEGRAPPVIQSAWDVDTLPLPSPVARVVIVGAGLTMVDVVTNLAASGHKGPIVSVSRHGLLHRRSGGHNPEFVPPDEPLGRTALALVRQVRRWCELSVAAHGNWRPAFDYARVNAPKLWRGLSQDEQRRLERHARPYWNVHRFLTPSYGFELVQKLVAKKRLVLIKGSATAVSAFVAHEDIKPSRAWQTEIENALHSMDAFAALMTENFHDSDWTDQEVGFALARGVPVIAVKLERDPYGFLGKFQALRTDWDGAAEGIVKLLMKHDRMFNAYIQALRDCPGWDRGNVLARVLPGIEKATEEQIDELLAVANDNTEVRYSFGFRGNQQSRHGEGLIPHLHRLGSRRFARGDGEVIVPAPQVKRRRRETVDDEIPF